MAKRKEIMLDFNTKNRTIVNCNDSPLLKYCLTMANEAVVTERRTGRNIHVNRNNGRFNVKQITLH